MLTETLIFSAGIGFGIFINIIIIRLQTSGTFKIDQSNSDKDLYLVDFSEDLSKIPKKKLIHLRVDAHANLSRDEPIL